MDPLVVYLRNTRFLQDLLKRAKLLACSKEKPQSFSIAPCMANATWIVHLFENVQIFVYPAELLSRPRTFLGV